VRDGSGCPADLRENARMKPLALLPLVLALAACGTDSTSVIKMPNGEMRSTSYNDAKLYCDKTGQSVKNLGLAAAQTGIRFRCEN
jgi:hypothetical protein